MSQPNQPARTTSTAPTRIVPERNDLAPQPVVINQLGGFEVEGLKTKPNGDMVDEAGNIYRWADTGERQSPGYYTNKMGRKYHPNGTVEQPWDLAFATSTMHQERPRDDQGAVASAIRNGSLVLMRTTEENAAIGTAAHDQRIDQVAETLLVGETSNSGGISIKAKVSQGNSTATPDQILQMGTS